MLERGTGGALIELVQDAAVLIRGTVSGRERDEEAPPIFLDSATPLHLLRANGTFGVEVALPADAAEELVAEAMAAFRAHPGTAPLFVRWAHVNGKGVEELRLRSRSLTVAPTDGLMATLRELFGAEHVRLVRSA